MTLHALGCEHPVAQSPLFFSQSGLMSLADAARYSGCQGEVGCWVADACWDARGLGYALLEAAARCSGRQGASIGYS